jgi:hypothetical protein
MSLAKQKVGVFKVNGFWQLLPIYAGDQQPKINTLLSRHDGKQFPGENGI